ncbi:MAG: hypothetical protein KDK78_07265, partial [Chlamydiia bacterium]|nr:hypothetical protein [Chlamydiia bacterium]
MIDASLAELNRLLQPTSQLPDPCAEVSECLLNLTPAVMAGLSDSEIHSLFSRCHARFPQATLAACDEQDPAPFHRALMESRAPKLLQRLDRIHAGQDQWGSDEIEAVAKRCIDYVEGRAVPPDDFDEQLDAFAVEHGLDCVRITQEWLTDDNWKDLLVRSLSNRHWNARLQLEIIVCLSHFEGLLDEAAELLTDNSERRDRLVDLGRRLSTFRGALSWLPDGSGTIARVEGLPPDAIQLVLQCIPVTHLELIGVKEKGTNQKPNDYDSDSDIEDDEDPTPSASLGAVLEEFASTGEGLHSLTLKNCTLKGDGSDLLLGLQHNGKLRHLKIDNAKWDAILPGNGLFSKLHSLENLESLTVRQTELFADCWLALPRIKKLRKLKLDVKLTHQEDN